MNRSKNNIFLIFLIIVGGLLMLGGCQPDDDPDDENNNNDPKGLSIEDLSIQGFASNVVTGFENIKETDASYKKVSTVEDFYQAIKSPTTKVIEIMNNLDLGFKHLSTTQRADSNFIVNTVQPTLHPTLLESGVSRIRIQDRSHAKGNPGLLIFSENGVTIKHAGFQVKRVDNFILRNVKFMELWEWDEATKGDYDKNDWDFITLEDCNGVWIDHCTFGKSYDGLIDAKEGNRNVTLSWNSFITEPDFVRVQMEYLEQNKENYPMFKFFRDKGMTLDDMIKIATPQKKGHLVGSSELNENNNVQTWTIHNSYYQDLQDRLTRLRAGNAHIFNVYHDANKARVAKQIRDGYSISSSSYKFSITSQSVISTEAGALFMENSILEGVLEPVKNNQKSGHPANYTGKVAVNNCEYKLNDTTYRGGSGDKNGPFISNQVAMLPFSWNGFSSLPYQYRLESLDQLKAVLFDENFGCGAGVVTFEKENWLKTTYRGGSND